MEDKILCGIIFGMVGGAVLATKSAKVRQVVKDGEQQIEKKMKELNKSNSKESK